ncbi:MAG TPA: right-handed parallel beta-helix repeat-containing protein [Thermoleophilaceae bacterium]|nr:right-handed parallel beta-helix repeat-containing protein [Thermoleophilaceae bacterium]
MTVPSAAMARNLVVGDGGPGCRDARYATIQSAVDAARPGDDIPVCPGTYREAVSVRTDMLRIFSRVRHQAVVELPASDDTRLTGIGLDARGVLVRGFTVTGVRPGSGCGLGEGTAISSGGGAATIDYNRIVDLGCNSFERGVLYSDDATYPGLVSVAHNEISGFERYGILAFGSPDTVHDNVIRGGRVGVQIRGGKGAIQANTIEDAGDCGICTYAFEASFDYRIAGNRLRRNGNGIHIAYVGSPAPPDAIGRFNAHIEANDVLDSVRDGITIELSRGFVYRNAVRRSGRWDCLMQDGFAVWKDNIGATDSPSNLCRAP